MGTENNLNKLEYKENEKSLDKMVESIKINYAIMLLQEMGKTKPK